MKKRKVCIILTTRGNYAKMESIMEAINDNKYLEMQLIVAGGVLLPKYGEIVKTIEKNYKINRKVYFLIEGENPVTMSKSAGIVISEFSTIFEDLKPDIVLVIGDRFESLPIAIAASYMNIIVAHLEGGEVSGSIDESIRHAITKLSHIHFPATLEAAERIKRLGEKDESIFVVGTPTIDLSKKIDFSDKSSFYKIQGTKGEKGAGAILNLDKPYLVVNQHPVTTEYEKNLQHINETIKAVDALKINTFWIWPNMDAGSDGISKGIRMYREEKNPKFIHFFKSLGFQSYARLLNDSLCILGNSSSGIREASFLGIPAVNIGTRQQGRARGGNVIDVDYDWKLIVDAIKKQIEHKRYPASDLYGDGNAGKKIAEVLSSYDCPIQKKISY